MLLHNAFSIALIANEIMFATNALFPVLDFEVGRVPLVAGCGTITVPITAPTDLNTHRSGDFVRHMSDDFPLLTCEVPSLCSVHNIHGAAVVMRTFTGLRFTQATHVKAILLGTRTPYAMRKERDTEFLKPAYKTPFKLDNVHVCTDTKGTPLLVAVSLGVEEWPIGHPP